MSKNRVIGKKNTEGRAPLQKHESSSAEVFSLDIANSQGVKRMTHNVLNKDTSVPKQKGEVVDYGKIARDNRIMIGLNKLKQLGISAIEKGGVLETVYKNIGISGADEITNGNSLIGTQAFKEISDMTAKWSVDIYKYNEQWKRIKAQYDNALSTDLPDVCTNKYKESKKLFSIINKVWGKLDILDYSVSINSLPINIDTVFESAIFDMAQVDGVAEALIEDTGNSNIVEISNKIRKEYGSREFIEYIVKEGVSEIMKRAGIRQAYMNRDNGLYMNALKYGNSFSFIENDNTDKDVPFKLRVLPIGSVIFDTGIKSIRSSLRNDNARRAIIVFDYNSLHDAISDYPELEDILVDKCAWGNLPFMPVNATKENWYSSDKLYRSGQIGMYFDIDRKTYILFAGIDATVIEYKDGVLFPFVKKGKPYFPVFMTSIFGNEDWIYKKGVGHFASQLNNIDAFTNNVVLKGFAQDNSQIDVLHIREGARNKVSRDIVKANSEAQYGSGRGVIMSEVSLSGEKDIYGKETLSGTYQWGMDKKQFIDRSVDMDVIEMGVNMQDVNNNPYKTAQAVLSENMLSLALGDAIEMDNAEEWREMVEAVLDRISSIPNSMPIPTNNFYSSIPEAKIVMQPTMGVLKKILKGLDISIETQFSGTMRSKDVPRMKVLRDVLSIVPPGAPIQQKLISEVLRMSGVQITDKDLKQELTQAPELMATQQENPLTQVQ